MNELIHNMFYCPEDVYTHYTPARYLTTLLTIYYRDLEQYLPYFKYYIREICFLSIQGKILQEQQNNYEDLYDACHNNLLCCDNFKKTALNYLKLISQQIFHHHLCLKRLKMGA